MAKTKYYLLKMWRIASVHENCPLNERIRSYLMDFGNMRVPSFTFNYCSVMYKIISAAPIPNKNDYNFQW